MQVRAIIEAAIECQKAGAKVLPEIMHPLVLDRKELWILEQATRRVADELIKKSGVRLNYIVGTMIELPRAALLAREIAEVANFFSFGTNDLTQTTMGLSRDDAGRFLRTTWTRRKPEFSAPTRSNPSTPRASECLCAGASNRAARPAHKLKIGICGEHGGDATA